MKSLDKVMELVSDAADELCAAYAMTCLPEDAHLKLAMHMHFAGGNPLVAYAALMDEAALLTLRYRVKNVPREVRQHAAFIDPRRADKLFSIAGCA